MSTTEKAKGAAPVVKGSEMTEGGRQDTVALWATKEGSVADLNGYFKGQRVLGFINKNAEKGSAFVSLKASTPDGLISVATGNAINTSKEGKTVYFDTLAFNDGTDKAVFAHVTSAITPELHEALGFTSARVERPARVAPPEPTPEEVEEDPQQEAPAAPRPRFG